MIGEQHGIADCHHFVLLKIGTTVLFAQDCIVVGNMSLGLRTGSTLSGIATRFCELYFNVPTDFIPGFRFAVQLYGIVSSTLSFDFFLNVYLLKY